VRLARILVGLILMAWLLMPLANFAHAAPSHHHPMPAMSLDEPGIAPCCLTPACPGVACPIPIGSAPARVPASRAVTWEADRLRVLEGLPLAPARPPPRRTA
jgi:hypothetical protein